jgi:predicted enzyme related to lactoylglutathione lyase
VRVADLDESVKQCSRLGGKVLNGPMDVPGGDRVAQCFDPQGAAFALHWKKPA